MNYDASGNVLVKDAEALATRYPLELAVLVAGTPVTGTFGASVRYVAIYCDRAAWVDESAPGTPADGSAGGRVYVAAGERRALPWSGTGIAVVNAVTGELPKVYVEGWA